MIHHRKKKKHITNIRFTLSSMNADKNTGWWPHPRIDIVRNFWKVEGADKYIYKCRVSGQE